MNNLLIEKKSALIVIVPKEVFAINIAIVIPIFVRFKEKDVLVN